jgi:hypothetical protein
MKTTTRRVVRLASWAVLVIVVSGCLVSWFGSACFIGRRIMVASEHGALWLVVVHPVPDRLTGGGLDVFASYGKWHVQWPSVDRIPSLGTRVTVPLWLILAVTVLGVVVAMRKARLTTKDTCATCGYDLTGNTSGVCAECGKGIT